MKLPIIVSAGMISATVAYNAYALTCGAQPSCSDLGYSYTGSTSDCVGPALKCPFNTSYFNCTKKPTLWPNCRPTSSLLPCLIIPRLFQGIII